MKRIAVLVLSVFVMELQANNLQPRVEKKSMTTSVIVPCVARHFFWLSGMLEAYENSTVKPDEIVISLSEVEKLDPSWIAKLEKGVWSFNLKILRNNGLVIDGDNRTLAMHEATGDIFIFSDADDIPHPQRVEIAKYFFENFELDHMIHSYVYDREDLPVINFNDIPTRQFDRFGDLERFANTFRITFGSPCFLRKIGDRVKWQAINDREYNREAYRLYPYKIVIALPLILYRSQLSSHLKKSC